MRSALARSNNNTSTKYEEHEWFITISDEYFSTMGNNNTTRNEVTINQNNHRPNTKAKPRTDKK
jgi:hypothetical protein